ncbi:MAG: ribulose-phosphate 3-epimerase [bacterium]
MVKVSVSILDCDLLRLGEELRAVEAAGADCIHLDVMDGRFVAGISFGRPVGAAVRRSTRLPVHSHLMVVEPEKQIDEYLPFSEAVVFHVEATPDPGRCIDRIRAAGLRAGMSLNPDTPVDRLEPWLARLDDVLVMSVFPGRGGQSFIPGSIERVREISSLVRATGSRAEVSVDGGVNPGNSRELADAGAGLLIAGSAVFRSGDYARAIAELRDAVPPAPDPENTRSGA